jgi:hypothetical protein
VSTSIKRSKSLSIPLLKNKAEVEITGPSRNKNCGKTQKTVTMWSKYDEEEVIINCVLEARKHAPTVPT